MCVNVPTPSTSPTPDDFHRLMSSPYAWPTIIGVAFLVAIIVIGWTRRNLWGSDDWS